MIVWPMSLLKPMIHRLSKVILVVVGVLLQLVALSVTTLERSTDHMPWVM